MCPFVDTSEGSLLDFITLIKSTMGENQVVGRAAMETVRASACCANMRS